ncbi:MAG TPA: SRPBCC family protein [Stellaceae bacterium]|nr:SRPBCC family protein [Stellaceae bacterium]
MTTDRRATIRVTHRFSQSPERVFDAWLDPTKAKKFLFATPAGEMVRAEIDARVGGHFTFVDRRNGEHIEHVGEYLEIDRPRRLVFTFAVPKFSAERTTVIVEVTPCGKGCELVLTHESVLPDYASRTEGGWKMIIEGLAAALG